MRMALGRERKRYSRHVDDRAMGCLCISRQRPIAHDASEAAAPDGRPATRPPGTRYAEPVRLPARQGATLTLLGLVIAFARSLRGQ